MNISCRFAAVLIAGCLTSVSLPMSRCAAASDVPAKTGYQWISVPDNFMAARDAVSHPSTEKWHVMVDVPKNATRRHLQAQVTQSCGNHLVDSMAVDFVTAALDADKKLATNLGKRILTFPLELKPYFVNRAPTPLPPEAKAEELWTPKPNYPLRARSDGENGDGHYRVLFGPQGGYPTEVIRLHGSGSELLDANSVVFILMNWHAPATGHEHVVDKEIVYRLVQGTGSHIE